MTTTPDERAASVCRAIEGGIVLSNVVDAALFGKSITLTATECNDLVYLIRGAREEWRAGRG